MCSIVRHLRSASKYHAIAKMMWYACVELLYIRQESDVEAHRIPQFKIPMSDVLTTRRNLYFLYGELNDVVERGK